MGYMAQDGIKWDASIAKEQIYCQSFVEHFKNNNETWAMWRRTRYPAGCSPQAPFLLSGSGKP